MAAEDKKWINFQDTLKKNERENVDKPKERKRSILQESIKRFMSDLPGEEQE